MKKILITMASLTALCFADLSVEQIQSMVEKIHQKRQGVELATLNKTKEPFIRIVETNTTGSATPNKPKAKILLHAIMNSRAFINENWKRVGDTVLGYKVVQIGKESVTLKNGNQIKKLFLQKKKNNFITIVKKGTK